MAKKKVPHQKAFDNIAKRLAETRSASKPSVPMGGKPVDFSAIPQIDLQEQWVEGSPPKPKPPVSGISPRLKAPVGSTARQGAGLPVSRMEETVAQVMREHPKKLSEVVPGEAGRKARKAFEAGRRTALPPLTADTVPMIPEATPPVQNKAVTAAQAGRNQMERDYWKDQLKTQKGQLREMINPLKKGASKTERKQLAAAMKRIFKMLGKHGGKKAAIGAAFGGPVGAAMGGLMEAASAAPVGMGQDIQAPAQGMPLMQQLRELAQPPLTEGQVVGYTPPIEGFDYAQYPSATPGMIQPMSAGVPSGPAMMAGTYNQSMQAPPSSIFSANRRQGDMDPYRMFNQAPGTMPR